jgi:hypothetical protein
MLGQCAIEGFEEWMLCFVSSTFWPKPENQVTYRTLEMWLICIEIYSQTIHWISKVWN